MKKLLCLFVSIFASLQLFASADDSTITFEDGHSIHLRNVDELHPQILDVLNKNYKDIQEYLGFNQAIKDYVHKKITGEKNSSNRDLPDYTFSIEMEDVPSVGMVREIVQERIDYLKGTGLPIEPDRYLIMTVVESGKLFLVVALDETYIPVSPTEL